MGVPGRNPQPNGSRLWNVAGRVFSWFRGTGSSNEAHAEERPQKRGRLDNNSAAMPSAAVSSVTCISKRQMMPGTDIFTEVQYFTDGDHQCERPASFAAERSPLEGWEPRPGTVQSDSAENRFSVTIGREVQSASADQSSSSSPELSTFSDAPPLDLCNSGCSQIAQGISASSSLLQPLAVPADIRLAAFKSGQQPEDGAEFRPSVQGMGLSSSPLLANLLLKPHKDVLQRHEERRNQLMMHRAVLFSQEQGLRLQNRNKEADKVALQRKLVIERHSALDLFEDDVIECSPALPPRLPRRRLGTDEAPLSDPLGLSTLSDEGSSAEQGAFLQQSLAQLSAFKPMARGWKMTAREKILRFRQMGNRYSTGKLANARSAEMLYEKESIIMKHILKQVEDSLRKAKEEQSFVADTFQAMMRSRIQAICQRVLPQEPLCDVLKRYKISGSSTAHVRNKEFMPLTLQDLDLCKDAWNPQKPTEEVMVNALGIKLLRKDLLTLAGSAWLNDEVINMYLELLKERSKLPGFPKCHFFNTFFYERLSDGGNGYSYGNVRRWTRKVDIFAFDKVIVPVHLSAHWTSAVINFRDRRFEFYDSMGNDGRHHLEYLKAYVQDEYKDKKKGMYDVSKWTFYTPGRTVPQQENFSDCGVFSCKFMNCQAQDMPFNFAQEHMPYFRQRLVIELLNSKVL